MAVIFSPSDVLSNDNARWQCIFSGLMRQVLYYDEDFNFDNFYVLCTCVYIRNVFMELNYVSKNNDCKCLTFLLQLELRDLSIIFVNVKHSNLIFIDNDFY